MADFWTWTGRSAAAFAVVGVFVTGLQTYDEFGQRLASLERVDLHSSSVVQGQVISDVRQLQRDAEQLAAINEQLRADITQISDQFASLSANMLEQSRSRDVSSDRADKIYDQILRIQNVLEDMERRLDGEPPHELFEVGAGTLEAVLRAGRF